LDNLVDAEWLFGNLDKPDIVVLDASYYLPAEQQDARGHFLAAHVPGARFFDIDEIADTDTQLPHMVPAAGRFEKCVSALGVSNTSRVVFYDQKGVFSAPRGWWMMRLFGHERVAVLDGGLPGWREAGYATETGEPPAVPPGRFRASFAPRRLRGLDDILRNIGTAREILLDARPAGRFDGTAPDPRPGLPSGHIPGSRNLPSSELLRGGRGFLGTEALRARFAAAGVDGSQPVVTSCGSGVSAAILALGLTLAGLGEAAIYDGSWTEWASREDTPKERS
jgi:thiosulfate/3-mercaptopyruvate sulfurtransferase